MRAAWSPTGDVAFSPTFSGGWKPMTLNKVRSHSGALLSGRPPSDPLRSLKRATRFIISSRLRYWRGRCTIPSSRYGLIAKHSAADDHAHDLVGSLENL